MTVRFVMPLVSLHRFTFALVLVLLAALGAATATPPVAHAQNPFLQNRGTRTIESIEFVGNTQTRTYVLERELGFATGDEYDPEQVSAAWERLESLAFIAYVEIETLRSPNSVSLIIRVEEDVRFNWAPGLEYSRRHGKTWLSQLRVGSNDLTGRGDTIDLAVEYWKFRSARLTLANPWILGNARLGVAASVYAQQHDWLFEPLNGLDVRDWGAELAVWRAIEPWVELRVTGGWREVQVLDGNENFASATVQDPFVELALEHDTRDARYYPTRGLHLRAATRFAGFGSDFDEQYAVSDLGASGFVPVPYLNTLAGHVGYRAASDPLPFYERTWMGGPMDLRGIEFGSIEGDEAFRASVEIRRAIAVLPLREGRSIGLGVHLFHDWGKAWEQSESFGDRSIHTSYGAGLHFNLNTSNFRFEWARHDDGATVFVFEDHFTF